MYVLLVGYNIYISVKWYSIQLVPDLPVGGVYNQYITLSLALTLYIYVYVQLCTIKAVSSDVCISRSRAHTDVRIHRRIYTYSHKAAGAHSLSLPFFSVFRRRLSSALRYSTRHASRTDFGVDAAQRRRQAHSACKARRAGLVSAREKERER